MTASGQAGMQESQALKTEILPIRATSLGCFIAAKASDLPLDDWDIKLDLDSPDARHIQRAAARIRHSDTPVAFPTETVYGLGADATRSEAVKGIYRAKQRPSDNPLIVHIASIKQLRSLLQPASSSNDCHERSQEDPIPEVYKPLIQRFWPGPLTIILPNPANTSLAREVTAGLSTFGARMPRNLLALVLIKLANVPVAAPSANASTKPSPTAAEHVMYDLNGRIQLIVDGGPCDIGVESTVVDGLSAPPLVLRPGGISLAQIRTCPGWESTEIGYKDTSEQGTKPRAPGMKYRHYSPRAKVVLFENGAKSPELVDVSGYLGKRKRTGIVRTRRWSRALGLAECDAKPAPRKENGVDSDQYAKPQHTSGVSHSATSHDIAPDSPIQQMLDEISDYQKSEVEEIVVKARSGERSEDFVLCDMQLGPGTKDIARGLFSALRDLDRQDVDSILVEGIDENEGDVAAAVMNRLRKAAEIKMI